MAAVSPGICEKVRADGDRASFGSWISRRRKALGLLQKELADQVGCSVSALQKIELDERRPSRAMAERLAEAWMCCPNERAMFVQIARGERLVEQLDDRRLPAIPAHPPVSAARHLRSARRARPALPIPPTPLFGRDVELRRSRACWTRPHCRLLTLIGPGGIGKTHLAVETVAQQQAAARWCGVCVPGARGRPRANGHHDCRCAGLRPV